MFACYNCPECPDPVFREIFAEHPNAVRNLSISPVTPILFPFLWALTATIHFWGVLTQAEMLRKILHEGNARSLKKGEHVRKQS